jgi:hypothetical protein
MGKIISIFGCFAQLFPLVVQGVVSVESAMKSAPGETKKATVLAGIKAAAEVAGEVPESHVQAASVLVDSVVDALNKTGWFTPNPKPQP